MHCTDPGDPAALDVSPESTALGWLARSLSWERTFRALAAPQPVPTRARPPAPVPTLGPEPEGALVGVR